MIRASVEQHRRRFGIRLSLRVFILMIVCLDFTGNEYQTPLPPTGVEGKGSTGQRWGRWDGALKPGAA